MAAQLAGPQVTPQPELEDWKQPILGFCQRRILRSKDWGLCLHDTKKHPGVGLGGPTGPERADLQSWDKAKRGEEKLATFRIHHPNRAH